MTGKTPGADASVCVLVSSCDAYSDVWDPFFTLFFRHWPDCPYPVFLISNEKTSDHERVTTLTVGPDRDWSSSFLTALDALQFDFVLVMMEDYLLVERPDTRKIRGLLSYMTTSRAACLRLFPVPGPDEALSDCADLGEILRGSPHRVSLQAALWNRAVLRQLVKAGESAWHFESEGSKRADELPDRFLSVIDIDRSPLRYLCTGVIRGRWIRPALKLLEDEGVPIDLSRRDVESFIRQWWRKSRYRLEEVAWRALLKRRSSIRSVT